MLVIKLSRLWNLTSPALILLLPEVDVVLGLLDVFAVGPAGVLVDLSVHLRVKRFDP